MQDPPIVEQQNVVLLPLVEIRPPLPRLDDFLDEIIADHSAVFKLDHGLRSVLTEIRNTVYKSAATVRECLDCRGDEAVLYGVIGANVEIHDGSLFESLDCDFDISCRERLLPLFLLHDIAVAYTPFLEQGLRARAQRLKKAGCIQECRFAAF